MSIWNKLASKERVEAIIKKLEKRNITGFYVENSNEAKNKALGLIKESEGVLVSTSVTAEQIGLKDEIDNSDRSVRSKYMKLDHDKDKNKIRVLRSTPDVIIGSVHAVTVDGQILIASNSGTNIASYSSGAGKVIWIVGTQKIVNNLEDGYKRLYEYVVPKEEKHMQDLYGVSTNVSKLLLFNKEKEKDRVFLIFVNEVLGF